MRSSLNDLCHHTDDVIVEVTFTQGINVDIIETIPEQTNQVDLASKLFDLRLFRLFEVSGQLHQSSVQVGHEDLANQHAVRPFLNFGAVDEDTQKIGNAEDNRRLFFHQIQAFGDQFIAKVGNGLLKIVI